MKELKRGDVVIHKETKFIGEVIDITFWGMYIIKWQDGSSAPYRAEDVSLYTDE